RNKRGAARGHVAAVDDGRDDRREGGGAADAEFLELLDEARLGVARWRARLVPLRLDLDQRNRLPLAERRQLRLARLGGLVALLVLALLVGGEEPTEGDDGSGCHELGGLRGTSSTGRGGRGDGHRGGRSLGVGHLRGHGALPDEV